MWFDAQAKLAEIVGEPPATSATSATQAPAARPVSQLSQVSQHPDARKPAPAVASVASVATPLPSARPFEPGAAPFRKSPGGRVLTWTGRVVSLDAWRELTEWERHGPNGRHWCGLCRGWHNPGQCDGGTL